jgi:DMSO/TMAO reductase YedYZ molybdopterin-dependent catalytic subunit
VPHQDGDEREWVLTVTACGFAGTREAASGGEAMMHRRDFLYSAASLPLVFGAGRAAQPSPSDVVSFPGLIVRENEPANLEFPFSSLDRFVVPTERFYVRSHFATPKIDPRSYKLRVEGDVDRPVELSLDELKRLPSQTRPVTFECAGNGRVFLVPKARGVAWQFGAVGNAVWTGVPLAAVLERAGVKSNAVEVILEGADNGTINDDPKSPGPIHFARSLPIAKARQADGVLLAHTMNGADLPTEHGSPLRAVVSGWYGMASVKWLTRIVVVERPFRGFFQTMDYSYFIHEHGIPVLRAVSEMHVKASIARPAHGEVVPVKSTHRISGAAWTGEAEVSKVEVSTDGGRAWHEATLLEKPVRYAWRLWEYLWKTPEQPGWYTLMARATDSRGNTQPAKHDPDRRTYMISHVIPAEIEVK